MMHNSLNVKKRSMLFTLDQACLAFSENKYEKTTVLFHGYSPPPPPPKTKKQKGEEN
jgi:hypothetical protein